MISKKYKKLATSALSLLAGFFAMTVLTTISNAEISIPETAFVNDEAAILTQEEKLALTQKLKAFKEQTSNEMAILIVQTTEPETIEQYSIRVVEDWKLGKKDKDNGILFTVAVQDRKMRLEIGHGLEGVLTDLASTRILDTYARPAFRQNEYYRGINEATNTVMAIAKNEFNVAELPQNSSSKNDDGAFAFVAYLVIYALIVLYRFLASTKSWWHGGVIGGSVAIIIALIFALSLLTSMIAIITATGLGLLIDYFASKNGTHAGQGNFWGIFWGGGGGSHGGGFGGGGFSGGGGSFGGGGGSSSW